MNSLFYPYIDPNTHLPIIDPGIMAQLDPNSHLKIDEDDYNFQKEEKNKNKNSKNKEIKDNTNNDINTEEKDLKENEDQNINIKINNNIQNNISYENFEKYIFDNSKNDNKELKYDLENYNNPINYDLYYQSM